MTLGELYDAAEACGFTFRFHAGGGVEVASPLLGWDRELTARAGLLDRAMRARWREFVAFVELKLLAAGHVKPELVIPPREATA